MVTTPRAEENALTASALDGDEQALGRLLAIHQQATYNVAYRVLGSEADARDAVQEAYLLAVRAIRGDGAPPRDVDRFRGWLR
ncbi:MAG: RNA polymerase sigma factor, partial [Chloroflexi bacterium]|nr:RNA polymerase sigma factor [Chloroflexota bacterium]